MGATDTPTGQSRIDYAKEKTIYFATEAGKWDEDGIDVFTFGGKVTPYLNVSTQKASDIIGALKANEGTTDTAAVIKAGYARHKETGSEQTVLFIITDGEPNDKNAVRAAIVGITKDLKNEHEFAISFLRIGKDPGVAAFLTELDDALPGALHDIVDVQAIEEVDFVEAFAKALHD
jgi:hypothetical protein